MLSCILFHRGRQSTITIPIVIPLWAAWHHNRMFFASQKPPGLKSSVVLSGLHIETHSAVLEQQNCEGRPARSQHPISPHRWLFSRTMRPGCSGKNMVSQWPCSHGCEINLSLVVTVSPKICVLSTSISSSCSVLPLQCPRCDCWCTQIMEPQIL